MKEYLPVVLKLFRRYQKQKPLLTVRIINTFLIAVFEWHHHDLLLSVASPPLNAIDITG